MRRPSALTIFVLSAFAWLVVLTLVWTKVTTWTSYPLAVISHVALEQVAPMWVRSVHKKPGLIEVDTSVEVTAKDGSGRKGDVVVESDPGRYAYGLPIFLALLLAARGASGMRGRVQRGLLGYVLLMPTQAFSLVMHLLMQVVMAAGLDTRALRVDMWQIEAIVYGYQVGVLVLPTLVPVLVWLWLDREFFKTVIVQGWRQSLDHKQSVPPPPRTPAA